MLRKFSVPTHVPRDTEAETQQLQDEPLPLREALTWIHKEARRLAQSTPDAAVRREYTKLADAMSAEMFKRAESMMGYMLDRDQRADLQRIHSLMSTMHTPVVPERILLDLGTFLNAVRAAEINRQQDTLLGLFKKLLQLQEEPASPPQPVPLPPAPATVHEMAIQKDTVHSLPIPHATRNKKEIRQ